MRMASTANKELSDLQAELKETENKAEEIRAKISRIKPEGKKNVVIFGAGLSSTVLIDYLLRHANERGWAVRVGDADESVARNKLGNHPQGSAFKLNASDKGQIDAEVKGADLAISMVPVMFHLPIAKACVANEKTLLTASYVSPEIQALDGEARAKKLLVMMECGVDPGIDHMTAMRELNALRAQQFEVAGFESFAGGLVAPECDDNPWGYKFSWNPRNVVLAGQGTSMFVQNGQCKYIPYHQLFRRYESIALPGWGSFEGYPNRDSLKYRAIYNLEDCPTVFRGTLRRPGFCDAWDALVQLGMTDDTYTIGGSENMTYREFINSFLLYRPQDSVELKTAYYLHKSVDSPELRRLAWLGIFDDRRIGIPNASPARILQSLLVRKWPLGPNDRDMLVMYNKYVYENRKRQMREKVTAMVIKGKDNVRTAMAQTVGLPVAMVAKQILEGKLAHLSGVHRPVRPEVYDPVLDELEDYGVRFETVRDEPFVPGMFS